MAAGGLVGELFTAHGRMVLGLCRLLLRDPDDAEDAAQQVFLSAHRAVLGGSVPREAPAWLAAIARNECRARIRARMREPLALPELPSDLPDPVASAIRAVDFDALRMALASLPRRQRRALILREFGGLSYDELGGALGVSQSAVESLLFRARQQLRSVLSSANAVAVPLALRDELARLIPGFDPGGVGLVARVAAVPVAAKLATAAVTVGVVATGAAELPQHRARPLQSAESQQPAPFVQAERPEPAQPVPIAETPPGRLSKADDEGVEREGAEARDEDAERKPTVTERGHGARGEENDAEDERKESGDRSEAVAEDD